MNENIELPDYFDGIWREQFENGIAFALSCPEDYDVEKALHEYNDRYGIERIADSIWGVRNQGREVVIVDATTIDKSEMGCILADRTVSGRIYLILHKERAHLHSLCCALSMLRIPLYKLSQPKSEPFNDIASFLCNRKNKIDDEVRDIMKNILTGLITNIISAFLGF